MLPRLLRETDWERIASRGFDEPRLFSALLHTLRWSCVTATDPKLFQAPYRAGIEVKAYQLAPLKMALGMPRVNLFIADDVGLGKTIEAGLIIRELSLRQKVRRVVICVPPSVVRQWREEMEERFGLPFVIYDRDYVSQVRQERGYAVNPRTMRVGLSLLLFIVTLLPVRPATAEPAVLPAAPHRSPALRWLRMFRHCFLTSSAALYMARLVIIRHTAAG